MRKISRALAVSLILVTLLSFSGISSSLAVNKKEKSSAVSSQNTPQKKKANSTKTAPKNAKSKGETKSTKDPKNKNSTNVKSSATAKTIKNDLKNTQPKTVTQNKDKQSNVSGQTSTQSVENKNVAEEPQTEKTEPDDWKIVTDNDKSGSLFDSIKKDGSLVDSLDDSNFLLVVGIILVVLAVLGIAFFCYLLFFKKRYVGTHFKKK